MNVKTFESHLMILAGDGQTDVESPIVRGRTVAIMSAPLGAPGMAIYFEEIPFPEELSGLVSFVGHPATRSILEERGAVTDSSGVNGNPGRFDFSQLEVGDSYIAVPLASNPRPEGRTVDAAIASVQALRAIRCTRIA